jgi:hypothetical protein
LLYSILSNIASASGRTSLICWLPVVFRKDDEQTNLPMNDIGTAIFKFDPLVTIEEFGREVMPRAARSVYASRRLLRLAGTCGGSTFSSTFFRSRVEVVISSMYLLGNPDASSDSAVKHVIGSFSPTATESYPKYPYYVQSITCGSRSFITYTVSDPKVDIRSLQKLAGARLVPTTWL